MFEVKDGTRRLYWTEDRNLIPARETRKQLRSAGYKLYLDGHQFKENQVKE